MADGSLSEVASLDSLLLKLALTDDDRLESVLAKTLPGVIEHLKLPHEGTRQKVLEMLSHINKRVKGQPSIKLPLTPLLDTYQRSESRLVANFAMVYVEMAAERADPQALLDVVPQMLRGVSSCVPAQRNTLLRLASVGLLPLAGRGAASRLPMSGATTGGGAAAEGLRGRLDFLESPADKAAFLEFGRMLLLYQPAAQATTAMQAAPQGVRNELLEAHQQLAESNQLSYPSTSVPATHHAEDEQAAAAPIAPPGLSLYWLGIVQGPKHGPLAPADAAARKLAFLAFTSFAEVPANDVLLHYLIAACDPSEQVSRLGDELLRKRCGIDSVRPAADLESMPLMKAAFALYHGTPANKSVAPQDRVQPASPALKLRLMAVFNRSIAAANCFPETLTTVFDCVYGANSSARLRAVGMEFAVWIFKHARAAQLTPMGPVILMGLLKLLDEDAGVAASQSPLQANIRSFAYTAVGQLAARMPTLVASQPGIAQRFFAALQSEPQGVLSAVREAMAPLATAFEGCTGDVASQLEEQLLSAVAARPHAARLAAVQWARRCFPFAHIPSRYVCVVGVGDAKYEVAEEAEKGLQPPAATGATAAAGATIGAERASAVAANAAAAAATADWPAADAVVSYVCSRHPRLRQPAAMSEPLALQPKAFLALLSFLQAARRAGGAMSAEGVEALAGLVEHACVVDSTAELTRRGLATLVELAADTGPQLAARYSQRLQWLRPFLHHTDAGVRGMAAQLLGYAAAAIDAMPAAELLAQMTDAAASVSADKGSGGGGGAARSAAGGAAAQGRSTRYRFEEQDGALCALGYLLAQCGTGVPPVPREALTAAASALLAALDCGDPHLTASALQALGDASLRGPLPLPEGDGMGGVVAAVRKHLSDEKLVTPALRCLGMVARGAQGDAQLLSAIADALIEVAGAKHKSGDVAFVAGEAAALTFGGVPLDPTDVLHRQFESLAVWHAARLAAALPAESSAAAAGSDDVVMAAAGTTEGSGDGSGGDAQRGGGDGDAREALQQDMLRRLTEELIASSKPEARSAGGVLLLSLITYCGCQPLLVSKLQELQDAFMCLLGDSSGLAQEVGGRGLSALYGLAPDAEGRQQLLDGFVAALQGGAKRRRIGATAAGASKESDASFAAYRELAALANHVGHPSLLYWLLDLANEQSTWIAGTRAGAFRFPSISVAALQHLRPHVQAMLPKLIQYQHDPNPRVRDAMSHVLRVLVPEPKAAVDAHYDAVVGSVLTDMGARSQRTREAATAVMGDLVQGRRWPALAPHLLSMWSMQFRALDDFADPVRRAALGTFKALRSASLRLCDAEQAAPGDTAAALEVVVGVLLDKGVTNSAAEVSALSVDLLAKLVKVAAPKQLLPHVSALVPVMLEALSGMEDSRLNYIEQHAERMGLDARRLEGARVSAASQSPMWDTLDVAARALASDGAEQALAQLMPPLCGLLKRGVGLNTRAGSARFVSSLLMRAPGAMKPHAATLAKALLSAARGERSSAARKAQVGALASVLKLCGEARQGKVVDEIVELFRGSEGSDAAPRVLAGQLCAELARSASDVLVAYSGQLLPLAFVGMHDDESDVAAYCRSAWEEGTSSASAALRLHSSEVCGWLLAGLGSSSWGRKKAAARALAAAVKIEPDALAGQATELMDALLQELPGRLWDGKEVLLEAAAPCARVPGAAASAQRQAALLAAVLDAAGKRKASYRAAALAVLQQLLTDFQPADHYVQVAPTLLAAVQAHAAAPPAAGSEGADVPPPLRESVACLEAAVGGAGDVTLQEHGAELASTLAGVLQPSVPWASRLAAAHTAAALLQRSRGVGDAAAAWAGALVPGLLSCLEEGKYSALRTEALSALGAAVEAVPQASVRGGEVRAAVQAGTEALLLREKNPGVAAAAAKLRDACGLATAMAT